MAVQARTGTEIDPVSVAEFAGNLALVRLATKFNMALQGRLNAVGTVTLDASQASTVVNDPQFGPSMAPILIPTTANAAAEQGNGTVYVSARTAGAFTLTHANNAQTDRTYIYVRIG